MILELAYLSMHAVIFRQTATPRLLHVFYNTTMHFLEVFSTNGARSSIEHNTCILAASGASKRDVTSLFNSSVRIRNWPIALSSL